MEPMSQAAPASITRPDDRQLAEAFRNLESAIGDLRCIASIAEIVSEDTIERPVEGWPIDRIRKSFPELADYQIHVLSDAQTEALLFAMAELRRMVRDLSRKYYAAYEVA